MGPVVAVVDPPQLACLLPKRIRLAVPQGVGHAQPPQEHHQTISAYIAISTSLSLLAIKHLDDNIHDIWSFDDLEATRFAWEHIFHEIIDMSYSNACILYNVA